MRIGEYHAFLGKAVKVGGGYFAVGVETGYVSVTHVVYEEHDDVGVFGGWHFRSLGKGKSKK